MVSCSMPLPAYSAHYNICRYGGPVFFSFSSFLRAGRLALSQIAQIACPPPPPFEPAFFYFILFIYLFFPVRHPAGRGRAGEASRRTYGAAPLRAAAFPRSSSSAGMDGWMDAAGPGRRHRDTLIRWGKGEGVGMGIERAGLPVFAFPDSSRAREDGVCVCVCVRQEGISGIDRGSMA